MAFEEPEPKPEPVPSSVKGPAGRRAGAEEPADEGEDAAVGGGRKRARDGGGSASAPGSSGEPPAGASEFDVQWKQVQRPDAARLASIAGVWQCWWYTAPHSRHATRRSVAWSMSIMQMAHTFATGVRLGFAPEPEPEPEPASAPPFDGSIDVDLAEIESVCLETSRPDLLGAASASLAAEPSPALAIAGDLAAGTACSDLSAASESLGASSGLL